VSVSGRAAHPIAALAVNVTGQQQTALPNSSASLFPERYYYCKLTETKLKE
jgi:hypothetical protein